MKNIYILLLLFLPLCGKAQMLDAEAMLDKAVEVMEFAKKNMPWVTLTLAGQK